MSLWLIVAILLLVGASAYMIIEPQLRPRVAVRVSNGMFNARVAKTDIQREQGLAGVDYLGENDAMLLAFTRNEKWPIWMKDMKIPIDILWLDESQKVVYIVKGASPDDYPTTYVPNDPARYVVELPMGSVDSRNIKIGSQAAFNLDEIKGIK